MAEKGPVLTLVHVSPEMTETTFTNSPWVRISHRTCLNTRELEHMGEQIE